MCDVPSTAVFCSESIAIIVNIIIIIIIIIITNGSMGMEEAVD
jgi:hypothetical protein